MPTPAYIKIEGQTQGNITAGAFTAESVGNIFVEGHEDQMLVQALKHKITVPTDPQSGQPAGQRVHGPLIITCSLKDAPINLSCSRGKLQFSRHLQRHWTKSDRKIMYGELFRPVLRVKREPHPYP